VTKHVPCGLGGGAKKSVGYLTRHIPLGWKSFTGKGILWLFDKGCLVQKKKALIFKLTKHFGY
jgi:hypothetical protein